MLKMESKKYFLGCSGWSYDHWVNRFYPEKISKSKWLEYYSKHFNTVEVNSTFYRFPTKKMLNSWYNRTPSDFVLTLKANQLITHKKRFHDTEEYIDRFYDLAGHLEDKLGCILFQLHPVLSKDMDLLHSIIDQLDLRRNNIIEFRHESWFCDEVYDVLRENRLGFCSISAPNLPEDLLATTDNAYIRFHGKKEEDWYRYLYSKEELEDWGEKIKGLKVKKVFCYFNNDYQANAIKNCKQLKKILE